MPGFLSAFYAVGSIALAQLPVSWQQLVGEALRLRQGAPARRYVSRLGRAIETRRFLKYIIRACQEL